MHDITLVIFNSLRIMSMSMSMSKCHIRRPLIPNGQT